MRDRRECRGKIRRSEAFPCPSDWTVAVPTRRKSLQTSHLIGCPRIGASARGNNISMDIPAAVRGSSPGRFAVLLREKEDNPGAPARTSTPRSAGDWNDPPAAGPKTITRTTMRGRNRRPARCRRVRGPAAAVEARSKRGAEVRHRGLPGRMVVPLRVHGSFPRRSEPSAPSCAAGAMAYPVFSWISGTTFASLPRRCWWASSRSPS